MFHVCFCFYDSALFSYSQFRFSQLVANGGDQEGLFHAAMGDSASLSYMPEYDSDYINGIFDLFAESEFA